MSHESRVASREILLRVFAGLAFLAPAPARAQEKVTVIRNATVVPVVGARIPNGTVIIRGSKIEPWGRTFPSRQAPRSSTPRDSSSTPA
jgi:hypothetical protein